MSRDLLADGFFVCVYICVFMYVICLYVYVPKTEFLSVRARDARPCTRVRPQWACAPVAEVAPKERKFSLTAAEASPWFVADAGRHIRLSKTLPDYLQGYQESQLLCSG